MTTVLIVMLWLTGSAAGFWLLAVQWRREFDLTVGDAVIWGLLALLCGPITIGAAVGIWLIEKAEHHDSVLMPKKGRRR